MKVTNSKDMAFKIGTYKIKVKAIFNFSKTNVRNVVLCVYNLKIVSEYQF